MATATPPHESFFDLRARAYELASTGRYKHWGKIASALKREGFLMDLIMRLDRDSLAVMMITRSCRLACA